MDIQLLVVCLVIIAAIGYAGWHVYTAIRRENDPCYGCEGCQLKGLKKKVRQTNECRQSS